MEVLIGFVAGTMCGVIVMALLSESKRADKDAQELFYQRHSEKR